MDCKKASYKGLEDGFIKETWEKIVRKVEFMLGNMKERSPHVAASGIYDDTRLDWWTSGFWPGILWVMYDMTGEDKYLKEAWNWDGRLEEYFTRESNFHHDVGFQFLPTAVIKYKLTGDKEARRRGLFAANFLAGRFNPAGNFIRAWNQEKTGLSIIDTAMNLSLLFWASEEMQDPRFRHIARAHADTVVQHFIREDGSVKHVVHFDPESGLPVETLGGQGFGPESAWSRGQSWAIYGMSNAYKYTGNIKYLRAAQRVAHFFIASLPEDGVPYWDFRLPGFEDEPRDTSAAACAVCGLLEMAKHLPSDEAYAYTAWAGKIFMSLTENYSTFNKPEYEGLLLEATGSKPSGTNVNVSLIYGDYFYIESAARLLGWSKNIF